MVGYELRSWIQHSQSHSQKVVLVTDSKKTTTNKELLKPLEITDTTYNFMNFQDVEGGGEGAGPADLSVVAWCLIVL